MAVISKMNINATPYDLAGRGNMSYIAGDGINIDANGVISLVLGSEGVTPAQLEALKQEFAQSTLAITGDLNTLTGQFNSYAFITTQLQGKVASIEAKAWSSEGIWAKIDIMPSEISSTVHGYVDSSEYRDRIAQSVWTQTQNEFNAEFERLNKVSGEMEKYGQAISITPSDGVKITAAEDSTTYTKVTNTGMEIWSDGDLVATATGKRFSCLGGFGVDDWIIEKGKSADTLVFYRVV